MFTFKFGVKIITKCDLSFFLKSGVKKKEAVLDCGQP